MTLRVAVLFSGGKDSTFATWIVQHQGWDVATLLTARPRSADSLMFHHPNVEWTSLQAEAMGLEHLTLDSGEKTEIHDLEESLAALKTEKRITGVVTGAVASDYQKTRFDNMCHSIGLRSFSPLWHKNPHLLIQDLRKANFSIILTSVSAKGLNSSWLGRELSALDWLKLEELSREHGIHVAGEGGEYESFVLDAPQFQKSIVIDKGRTEWDGQRGRYVIEEASLRDKPSD